MNVYQTNADQNPSGLKQVHVILNGWDVVGYYWKNDALLFVIDSSMDTLAPDHRLIIKPDSENPDRKWDAILSGDYGIDLETIRPKKDNKYQKLDIEYRGLDIYDSFLRMAINGASDFEMDKILHDLNAVKIHNAVGHAERRLNENDSDVEKSNETIVKTQKTIDKLDETIEFFRERLALQRQKNREKPNGLDAAKIIRTEEMIATNQQKQKKSEQRLRRAEKRAAAAKKTADAARQRLLVLSKELKKYPNFPAESDDVNVHNGVAPLVTEDPKIIKEEIAFKPVDFQAPEEGKPMSETFIAPTQPENTPEQKPIVQSVAPVIAEQKPAEIEQPVIPVQPTEIPVTPILVEKPAPAMPVAEVKKEEAKQPIMYYFLLVLLIGLSIATLYLYQTRLSVTETPNLNPTATMPPMPENAFMDTNPDHAITETVTTTETITSTVYPPMPEVVPAPTSTPDPVIMPEPVMLPSVEEPQYDAPTLPMPMPEQSQQMAPEFRPTPQVNSVIPAPTNIAPEAEQPGRYGEPLAIPENPQYIEPNMDQPETFNENVQPMEYNDYSDDTNYVEQPVPYTPENLSNEPQYIGGATEEAEGENYNF